MTDQAQQNIYDNIEQHGRHCQSVMGDEGWPRFTVSIGFGITRKWPEILIVGPKMVLANAMLWRFWEAGVPLADSTDRFDILDDFCCKLRWVHESWHDDLFGRAQWAYRDRKAGSLTTLQCIWPTTSGSFPWEDASPERFSDLQPLVSGPHWSRVQ